MQVPKNLSRPLVLAAVFLGLIALPAAALAASDMVVINPGSIKWGDAVAAQGAKLAVLYGDPSKAGPIFAANS